MMIFPLPKKMEEFDEIIERPKFVSIEGLNDHTFKRMLDVCKQLKISQNKKGVRIVFSHTKGKKGQYSIKIDSEILIDYVDEDGIFSAISTLKQVFLNEEIHKLAITDYPTFQNRGLMLDISRNRVYNLSTIFKVIDIMADVKYNQLQLSVEGRAFFYPSFEKYYKNRNDFLTSNDIKAIDSYAKSRGIQLIGNQNSFGHMTYWINQDEFKHLAECPNGFDLDWMRALPSMTINPTIQESFEFIKRLYDDYVINFSSKNFNICGDEPFELGLGKSKDAVKKYGKAKVYGDFITKIYDYFSSKGMKIQMWGDVLKSHIESLEIIPKDVTILEWGYEGDCFKEEDLKFYKEKGYDFYVCPGTSMWNSITGIGKNMLENVKRASKNGSKCGAVGLLLTDWGDGGSWQQLSLCYYSYLIGAAYAWNTKEQDKLALEYLNKYIFNDKENRTAQFIYSLSNSYLIEEKKECNATKLFKTVYMQQTDNLFFDTNYCEPSALYRDHYRLSEKEYHKYYDFFKEKLSEFKTLNYECNDKKIVDEEILFTLKISLVASILGIYATDLYIRDKDDFLFMKQMLDEAINHFESTWKKRNKKSDFSLSINRMYLLKRKLSAIL